MPNFTYHYVFEPATEGNHPPLLLLHGTGGDEHDLLRLGRTISPGSALLSPRGDVSEGGALRFFARLGEGRFDPSEVKRRTNALADFVLAAARHHRIEVPKLIAVGFSNGANIGATMMQLRPEALGGAILFRPMLVLNEAATAGSLAGRRVLITNGNVDPLVPLDQPPRLAELLRAGGADVKSQVIPASHALTPQDVALAEAWIKGG